MEEAGGWDWTDEELAEALALASDWAVGYRERVERLPVLPAVRPGQIRARLGERPPAEPAPFDEVLADFDRSIVPGLTHWNHPGFLAYFSSSARGPSVAAELLIAAVGVNAMLWRTSPAATEVEETAVDWLRQAVGLPSAFRGLILDTASTSTFTALLAARERAGEDVREQGLAGGPELAAYASEQAHSSVEKAAMAAGLGRSSVRRVASDAAFRLQPEALERAMGEDAARGTVPAFVCATIGTTSTASVDPVDRMADLAERHQAWLHVDAAYAGPAAMLDELRPRFRGWERADSIVLNPHKWLGTSLDCSVLLFRDPDPFRRSLALTPAYLESEPGSRTDLMDFGLPLGRRFRGLKLWALFRCVGTRGLARTLREHVRMAEEAAAALEKDGRFRLAAPASFGTVCFRAAPVSGMAPEVADRWNREILERVNREGRVFLSHTVLESRYTLRLSIGSVHTRARHVAEALEALRRARDASVPAAVEGRGGEESRRMGPGGQR